MKDTIYRDDAVALVIKAIHGTDNKEIQNYLMDGLRKQMWALPSAENSNAKTQNSNQKTQKSNGDLIYRADAIEAIQDAYCKLCKERGDDYNEVMCRACNFDDAMMQIDALPSAEPSLKAIKRQIEEHWYLDQPSAEAVQGWIPCSEGLPDVGERCLVTLSNKVVAIGTLHSAGECEDDFGHIVRWEQRWHLEPSSIMIAYPKDSVVAWMPRPKPYKGGDSE